MERLNILLLTVEPSASLANTIRDHIGELRSRSRHRIYQLQNHLALLGSYRGLLKALPASFPLERFDALVVHYSNYMALEAHFDAASREKIARYAGVKVAFIQDEYRSVNATVSRLREMKFDALFTCVPEHEVEKVYPAEVLPGLTKVSTLTGFVTDGLLKVAAPPIWERGIDVGYRARVLPFWLGELGAEKSEIAHRFSRAAQGSGLKLDVSCEEADRLYGAAWIDFLLSCKAVLGVESGASVFDFTGELQRKVDQYVADHPGATFSEVQARFLLPYEGRISLNQISPRCFEAAALRTAMVLYEGEYSGILQPWRHYIPLRKDFSNFEEVAAALRDPARLQDLADRTYREIALNPRYAYPAFVEKFDKVVAEAHARRHVGRARRVGAALPSVARVAPILRAGIVPAFIRALVQLYVWTVPARWRMTWRPYLRKNIVKG